jgi:hypothetical protein
MAAAAPAYPRTNWDIRLHLIREFFAALTEDERTRWIALIEIERCQTTT